MTWKYLYTLRQDFDNALKTITRYAVCAKKSGIIYGLFAYEDSARVFIKNSDILDFYEIRDMDSGAVL